MFRSNWESTFAKFLILSRIKWRYESKTFDLGDTTYTPDFYLPELNAYIEIKGYFSEKAKEKINNFRKVYKRINLIVIDETKYMNIIGIRR
jgi:predicted nuclease of restriction endonuclease-like RecB superfamily